MVRCKKVKLKCEVTVSLVQDCLSYKFLSAHFLKRKNYATKSTHVVHFLNIDLSLPARFLVQSAIPN